MARVLVTGGTGFIGGRLVEALLARGDDVRALARRPPAGPPGDPRLEWAEGDLTDAPSLARAVRGCTHVWHLAAYAKNWARDPATYARLNVGGARNVFEAARGAGVERVVFTSTIVVLGPTPPGVVGDETMPRTTPHCLTEYEESKVAASREAARFCAEGVPIVTVLPTRVYGPGRLTEGNSVTTMLDQYDRGRFPVLLNGGRDVGNWVLVDDLVRGHLLAMERGRPGETYILGGENASLAALFRTVDEVTGRSHRQVNLPAPVALLYARLERRRAALFGAHPKITPGWVETFLRDWAFTSARAERELGYRPTPLCDGVRLTLDWLRRARSGA